MEDNIINLHSTPTSTDEEFSIILRSEVYTVRRKADYPYRLVLKGGVQLLVLPIEFPVEYAETAIRAYAAGVERGKAAGRDEIRDGIKKLLRMENAP